MMNFFEPQGAHKGSVLIAPAMGVEKGFYRAIAEWLASQGFLVATFDYRGMQAGVTEAELKSLKTLRLQDWAKEAEQALDSLIAHAGASGPVFWLGHSLGGQIFGLISNSSKVTRMISVASGSGYWLQNSWALRWRVWWLWYFVVPVVTPIKGYFPGKKLKMVGDLPAGIMYQWRSWCLNREYLVGVEGAKVRESYAQVATPMTVISVTDDELMSKQNIESLYSFYTHAPQKKIRIRPEAVGLKQIRHFGFFRSKVKDALWVRVLLPELN